MAGSTKVSQDTEILTVIMLLFAFCIPSSTIVCFGVPDIGSNTTPKDMSPSDAASYDETGSEESEPGLRAES